MPCRVSCVLSQHRAIPVPKRLSSMPYCHQSMANCPGGLLEPGLVCRKVPKTTHTLRLGV